MNKSVALLTAALLIAAGPALAQDKAKAAQRVQNMLLENDKVRVYESISKPGKSVGAPCGLTAWFAFCRAAPASAPMTTARRRR